MHNVTLIKGDGIGPSIMEVAVKIINAMTDSIECIKYETATHSEANPISTGFVTFIIKSPLRVIQYPKCFFHMKNYLLKSTQQPTSIRYNSHIST